MASTRPTRPRQAASYNESEIWNGFFSAATYYERSARRSKATPSKAYPSKATQKTAKSNTKTPSKKTTPSKMTASNKTPNEAMDSALSSHFSPESYVTLLVGPTEQKMIAYGSHLARDSDFFAAAMKKEWVEGQTHTIKLPEECPATMAHYLSYLYSGKLFTEDIKSVPGEEILPCFQLLASLCVACERFLNTELQYAVLAEIRRLNFTPDRDGKYWYPTSEAIATIYDGTPEGSQSRRFLVNMHVDSSELAWLSEHTSGLFVTPFVVDMINAMHGRIQDLQHQ